MKTDTLLYHDGMKALRERLGLIESERFIALVRRETFDYTEWQQTLWENKTVDDVFMSAKVYSEQLKN